MSIKIRLHQSGKLELAERLSDNRKVLRDQISKLTRLFMKVDVVKVGQPAFAVGQPAFAVGCEMSSNVRSLIRRDQRLSLG